MGRRESTIAGSTLLAICFLMGGAVRAMEPAQSGMPTSSVSGLPSFLAGERVPTLEEAWRASGQPSPEARPQQGEATIQFGTPAADDPMDAARAAMKRAKQPGRDDASVRRRAEELSRRFGAGRKTSVPATEETPPSVTFAPVVPPKESSDAESSDAAKRVAATPEAPVRKEIVVRRSMAVTTGALSPSQELQPFDALDASVRTQSAMTTERLRLAAPPPPSDVIPALPKRAPNVRKSAAAAPSPPTQAAIVHTKPRRSYAGTRKSADPMAALRGTVLTNELRSFGWNSQPK